MSLGHRLLIAGSLAALAAATFSASAQTIRQRQALTQDRQLVAERIAAANRTCGANVNLTVDWNSFADVKSSPENPNDQSAWAFVANATDAMDAVCRSSSDGKAMIASNLHTIMVSHTSAERMNYSNGVLNYGVPYQGAGYSKLKDYMLDNIGGRGMGNLGAGRGEAVQSTVDELKRRLKLPF